MGKAKGVVLLFAGFTEDDKEVIPPPPRMLPTVTKTSPIILLRENVHKLYTSY